MAIPRFRSRVLQDSESCTSGSSRTTPRSWLQWVRHTHKAGVLRLIEIVATPGRVENHRAAAAQRCQL